MPIKYFTKNINLSGDFKNVFENKIKKFYHLAPDIKEINVDLSYSPFHAKNESIRLEVSLEVFNKNIVAATRAANFLEAIDIIEEKIKKQLEKAKESRQAKRKITRRLIRETKSL